MFGSVALITKKAIGSERANENYGELEGTEMCLKTGRKTNSTKGITDGWKADICRVTQEVNMNSFLKLLPPPPSHSNSPFHTATTRVKTQN